MQSRHITGCVAIVSIALVQSIAIHTLGVLGIDGAMIISVLSLGVGGIGTIAGYAFGKKSA